MIANIIIWSLMALVVAIVAPATIRDVNELFREHLGRRETDGQNR